MRKIVTILLLCLSLLGGAAAGPSVKAATPQSSFTDIGGSYAKKEIEYLKNNGIMSGYNDKIFNPKGSITREEFAVVLVNALRLPVDESAPSRFIDVDNWAVKYVNALAAAGIAQGVSDTTFGARLTLNKEEMTVLWLRGMSFGTKIEQLTLPITLADANQISPWATKYVQFAYDNDLVEAEEGTLFGPGKIADRQSVAKVAYLVVSNKSHIIDQMKQTLGIPTDGGTADAANTPKAHYFVVSVLLEGIKEETSLEEIDSIRRQLSSIDPHLRVSWAMDNNFIFWETHRPQLKRILEFVDTYGDEISIADGFANNSGTLENFTAKMNQWLYMYRYNALNELHVNGTAGDASVLESIPVQYRPASLTGYSVNQAQIKWLQDNFQIYAYMGWAATQYNVDQLTGEGSPLMPYFAHEDNPMVPAQNSATNSGAILLNGITIDPIGSVYVRDISRWTIHPADPLTDGKEQLYTIGQYLNNPYQNRNTVNYLSLIVDLNWIYRTPEVRKVWDRMIEKWDHSKPVTVVGVKQFADIWSDSTGANNKRNEFTLLFRGSGETAGYQTSAKDTQYLWTETKTERLILSKKDGDIAWKIIDFTDYSKHVPQLRLTSQGRDEDISFITGRNFKIAPAAPIKPDEMERIKARLKQIDFNESFSE